MKVHLLQEPEEELLENRRKHLKKEIRITCSANVPDTHDSDILVCGVPDRNGDSVEMSGTPIPIRLGQGLIPNPPAFPFMNCPTLS